MSTTDALSTAFLPPLVPRAVLFGNPEKSSPQISPDGKRLAYLAAHNGVLNVWVRGVNETNAQAHPVTNDAARPVRFYLWAENSRHILYLQDAGGDENFHLYAVDVEATGDGSARDLTPFPNVRATPVGTDPNQPDIVLVSTNQRDPQVMDVWRVSLTSGERELVAENPGNIVGWEADYDLRVRAAITRAPDGTSDVLVRDDENGPWRTLMSFPFGETGGPEAFTADNKNLYLRSNKDANTQGLYLADLQTNEVMLICERPGVDLGAVLFHPTRHTLQAVSYTRARREWVALDETLAADFATLKTVTDGDFSIDSRSRDDAVWVVSYNKSDGSPVYYVYDRNTKTTAKLFSAQPALDDYHLAPVEAMDIPARDGLVLPCYLTLPVGVAPENLPFVLWVHGGPWARDTWGYSPFVQWLASRGYGVLQINFRGSTGFGKDFLNAGNREWAGKMHTDLLDGVNYLVEKGLADPARVAIMGGSYGGYATLVGLTLTPDVFACGVDLVGPSDITTLFASIPPYWKPLKSEFLLRVGDPDVEPEFIKSISPLYHADKITRPLLIAQGANDPRVKQAESDQIVQTMRGNGQKVTYLLFADEGHGFARPENNLKFTAAAEAFLADHLGGRCEPAHDGEEPPLVR